MSHASVVKLPTFTQPAARERKQPKIYSTSLEIRFIFRHFFLIDVSQFLYSIIFGKIQSFLHVVKSKKSSIDDFVPFPDQTWFYGLSQKKTKKILATLSKLGVQRFVKPNDWWGSLHTLKKQ